MRGIDLPRYERIWMIFGIGTLAVFLLITGIMGFAMERHPADGHIRTVPPEQVRNAPPFDKPGLYPVGENEYRAVMLAQVFNFLPNTLTVPKGATVHFAITAPDVLHGMAIPGTTVNMMILPGHVTEFTYTFDKPGEYVMLCNEYCGVGHHVMFGKLIVHET